MADNVLKQVITYNESNLAFLLNSFAFISTSNKKFQRFNDDIPKNLGDTVQFDLPPRMTTKNSLIVSFQAAVQRYKSLTVDQQASTAYEFTAQQFIFNVRDYMEKFGRAAVAEIGSKVEANIAKNAETGPFRFYGNATTAITSSVQLANALAFFRNFGAAKTNTKGYLSDMTYPEIVNNNLTQFALARNNKEAMSWEVGNFANCDWYQSNLLTTHISGTVGNSSQPLTVVSTSSDQYGNVNSITFSGATPNDPNAIKKYDSFQFSDGVVGKPNLRFLTFIGHEVSQCPVQFKAAADAQSDGAGNVTVLLDPYLNAAVTQGQSEGNNSSVQYCNTPIVAGMVCGVQASHRCGLIMAGDPLYLAMPKLPDEVPFPSSSVTDPDSGASLRQYYGSLFGQNQRGMVHDVIWGSVLVPEYSMKVILPL